MKTERRLKGSGTLFKRPNGYYVYQFIDIDGKTKTKTLRDSDGKPITLKSEAEKYAASIRHDVDTMRQLSSRAEYLAKAAEIKQLIIRKQITLDSLWQKYLASPNRPDSGNVTLQGYESILNRFISYCSGKGFMKITDVIEDTAMEYMAALWAENISSRTYNKHLQALKLIFKTVLGDTSPFIEIKTKTLEQESRQAFTPQQINDIFSKLDEPDFYMLYKNEMRLLLMLGLAFGLRLHDAACFQWSFIKGDTVEFKPAKTRRRQKGTVILPIPAILQNQFETARNWKVDCYVLPKVARRYMTNPSGISQDINKLLQSSGIETREVATSDVRRHKYIDSQGQCQTRHIGRYSFHSFRHTFCTLAANAGHNPSVIRSIVGHSDIKMTAHYTHYSLDAKRQVMNAIPLPDSVCNPPVLHDIICQIPASKLALLAGYLDANLSLFQKSEVTELWQK